MAVGPQKLSAICYTMPRRFYVLLTLTVLAGAFLRLWQLTEIPPGLHYDLAATALLGNEVAFHGLRPVFITAYTGHEVLFYYWLALWFRLVGSSVFTLRLAAALLGVLTLPAAFFAIREAMRFEEHSFSIAAFSAVLLATAFFHLTFSRFGFRVILQPLVQSLALGFLFRALRRSASRSAKRKGGDWELGALRAGSWDFVLGGFFTGLAAYTYLAARLFPVPLAIFWLALLVHAFLGRSPQPAARRAPLGSLSLGVGSWSLGFGIFFLSALLTFAPLGLYFLQHPEDFLNRASQVAPHTGEGALLLEGIRRAAEMIFINGEPYDRFNIPGLPLLSPLPGVFFVVGLLITLRNCFRAAPKFGAGALSERGAGSLPFATELLLLAWLPAMLAPTALSVHDVFPSNVRAFGLIPLLFVFPARGLLASYRWVQARMPGPLLPFAYPVTALGAVLLAFGTFNTSRDYFDTWAHLPNQRLNNDADLTAIAGYLNGQDLTRTSAYVSAIHYRHPTLAYLARDFQAIRWFTGGASLVIPADREALYLFARSAPPPEEWIAGWGDDLVAAPPGPDNVPDFRAYRISAGEMPALPGFTPLSENFGYFATLAGYRLISEAGQVLVDLRWKIENLPEAKDFLPYARLYDVEGRAWSQSGGFSYPSEQWVPGDALLTRVAIPLPAGLPPGTYLVKAGMYSASAQASLPRLDANGGFVGERAPLAEIQLSGGPTASEDDFIAANPMTPPARVNGLDGNLTLLGYTLNTTSPRQGERVELTLFWRARAALEAETLMLTLSSTPVLTESFPLSEWPAGQVLLDRRAFKIPSQASLGLNELSVNVPRYGAATLGTLDVIPVERTFTAPPGLTEAHFTLGGDFELYGYQQELGPPTRLRLVWKSLAPSNVDYTVFVHVLAPDQLLTQSDAPPRQGAYPTSLWVPGEFVTDDYSFGLGRGAWAFEVGLYRAEDGVRLPVFDVAGKLVGDAIRLPGFQIP